MEQLKGIKKELCSLKIKQYYLKDNDVQIYKQLKDQIIKTKKEMAFCIIKEKEMKSNDKHKTR